MEEKEKLTLEQYKEFYELSLKVLQHEDERFRSIDEKATRYFSVLTILLGLAGFLGQQICEKILPPATCLEYFLFIFAVFLACSLVVAWVFLFFVMMLRSLYAIPMNDEMIAFWKTNNLLDIYNAMAKKIAEVVQKNIQTTERKIRWLRAGYYAMAVSLVFLVLFSILFVIHAWTTKGR